MLRATTAPLWLLLAVAGCVLPPAIPPSQLEDWHAVDWAEARILSDLPPDELARLAGELALFDAAFAHLVGRPPEAHTAPVRIFVLREGELARRLGLGGAGAGWAFASLDGAFSVVAARGDLVRTRTTLFHEYTHVLTFRNRRVPLPSWYAEGLATFFGTLHVRDGAFVVGAPPGTVVARLVDRGPLPLEELFTTDVWECTSEGVFDFYATSWALSHHLLLTPRGRREMSRLADEISRGTPPEQAHAIAFGRPPAEIDSELRGHVAALARGVPAEAVLDVQALAVREPGLPVPLAPADAACELGQLTLRLATDTGDLDERPLALALLERGASGEGASVRCEAARAEALAEAGDAEGASGALVRTLARAPDDPRVQLSAGRVELALAGAGDAGEVALAAAEGHFRRALALDPDSAAAWFGLGRSLEAAGQADAALTAFETARRYGWSSDLDLALGRLELARGNRERAVALLWPLAQDRRGGSARDAASELLEQAGLPPAPPGS